MSAHGSEQRGGSDERGRIAIALSGGGHRASLFALGVLLYLVDAGKNGSIASIASVSGGSLTNGAVAQSLDLTAAAPEDLRPVAARLAGQITNRGTLFGTGWTFAYLLLAAAVGVLGLVVVWFLPISIWVRIAIFLISLVAIGWLVRLRGRVCRFAFDRTLFRPDGRSTRLAQINGELDHVFCATDLHAGEHVYFSRDFVYSYRFGLGVPADLSLSAAVQASAAFPGAFPATWLPTRRHAFEDGHEPQATSARRMALVDGGVYDNMADQWAHGMAARLRRGIDASVSLRDADQLVVVSASAGLEWGTLRGLRLPGIGELLTLLRDKSVLYDNGNSLRRQILVDRFDLAHHNGRGMRGALVHIPQSPFRVPRAFSKGHDERAERAKGALELLATEGVSAERDWDDVAAANAAVATTLVRFDPPTTVRLLRHAYVLAMVNLHVLLDYPLLDLPGPDRFEALAAGRAD